eukprot:CAMPEP_0170521814 /NCGR_PEP_ID=MMETSP0209-20121228/7197_1 /TAXON_ID=665100 ORGANISM="Litonotus pictus, Strain P1" /NCGR_SAMPLE_ID=MMETSP0209 /ASSEMBLY_ACC=CAM_ASM_000301 /LENGTH=1444 /DNA_ID=CAMNT_0010808907 /DNA_START=518 /DNA_END=4852 /DNA_ORIENTATION=-
MTTAGFNARPNTKSLYCYSNYNNSNSNFHHTNTLNYPSNKPKTVEPRRRTNKSKSRDKEYLNSDTGFGFNYYLGGKSYSPYSKNNNNSQSNHEKGFESDQKSHYQKSANLKPISNKTSSNTKPNKTSSNFFSGKSSDQSNFNNVNANLFPEKDNKQSNNNESKMNNEIDKLLKYYMAQLNDNIDMNYDDEADLEEESSLDNANAFNDKNKQKQEEINLRKAALNKESKQPGKISLTKQQKDGNSKDKENMSNNATKNSNIGQTQSKFLSKNNSNSDLNFSKYNKSEKSNNLNQINNISEIKHKNSPIIHNNSNSLNQILDKNPKESNLSREMKGKRNSKETEKEDKEKESDKPEESSYNRNKVEEVLFSKPEEIIEEDEVLEKIDEDPSSKQVAVFGINNLKNKEERSSENEEKHPTPKQTIEENRNIYNDQIEEEVIEEEPDCNQSKKEGIALLSTDDNRPMKEAEKAKVLSPKKRNQEIMIENQESMKTPRTTEKPMDIKHESTEESNKTNINTYNTMSQEEQKTSNQKTEPGNNIFSMFEKLEVDEIEEYGKLDQQQVNPKRVSAKSKNAPGSSKIAKSKPEEESQPNIEEKRYSRNTKQEVVETEEDYGHIRIVKSFEEGEYRQNIDQFDVEYMSRCLGLAVLKHLENGQEKFHVVDILSEKTQKFNFFNSIYNSNFEYFRNFFDVEKEKLSNLQRLEVELLETNKANAGTNNEIGDPLLNKIKRKMNYCQDDEDELNKKLSMPKNKLEPIKNKGKDPNQSKNNLEHFNKVKEEFSKKEKQKIIEKSKENPENAFPPVNPNNSNSRKASAIDDSLGSITYNSQNYNNEEGRILPSLSVNTSHTKDSKNESFEKKTPIVNKNETNISYFGHMKFNDKEVDTKFPPKIDLPKISKSGGLDPLSAKVSGALRHTSDFMEFDKELKTIDDYFKNSKTEKYKNLSATTKNIMNQNLAMIQEINSVQYCKDQLLHTVNQNANKGEEVFTKSHTQNIKNSYNFINTNKAMDQVQAEEGGEPKEEEADYVDIMEKSVIDMFGVDKTAEEELMKNEYDIKDEIEEEKNEEDYEKSEDRIKEAESKTSNIAKTEENDNEEISNYGFDTEKEEQPKSKINYEDIQKQGDEAQENTIKITTESNLSNLDHEQVTDQSHPAKEAKEETHKKEKKKKDTPENLIKGKFSSIALESKEDTLKTFPKNSKSDSIDFSQLSPQNNKVIEEDIPIEENNLPELQDNHFESGFVESNYIIDIQDAEKLRAFLLKNAEIYDDDFDYKLSKIFHKRFVPPPDPSSIFEFCANVMIMTKMEKEVIIITLIYLERFIFNTGVLVTSRNWKRLVFTAMILASKIWDDDSFENNHFAQVFTHLSVGEINLLERTFLELINYKVYVKCSEYFKYFFIVKSIALKYNYDGVSLVPISLPKMMKLQEYAYQAQKKLRKRYVLNNSTSN